jgi:hypothetical protein
VAGKVTLQHLKSVEHQYRYLVTAFDTPASKRTRQSVHPRVEFTKGERASFEDQGRLVVKFAAVSGQNLSEYETSASFQGATLLVLGGHDPTPAL